MGVDAPPLAHATGERGRGLSAASEGKVRHGRCVSLWFDHTLTPLRRLRTMPDMSERRPIPSPESFPLHTDVAVRFRDVDAMGHVNNAVYLSFFEEARVALFHHLGLTASDRSSLEDRFPFILAEATCRYLSPARVGETLRAHLRVARIGTTSFDFEYLILERNTGRPVATGRSVQVAFDYGPASRSRFPSPCARSSRHTAAEASPNSPSPASSGPRRPPFGPSSSLCQHWRGQVQNRCTGSREELRHEASMRRPERPPTPQAACYTPIPVARERSGLAGGGKSITGWPRLQPSRWRWAWLLAALPFAQLLHVGFLNDDYALVVDFAATGWHGVLEQLTTASFQFYRPLAFAFARLELDLFGTTAWAFHAFHLLLWVIAAWLTGRIAGRAIPAAAPWAAALALLYPGRLETVAWVCAFFDLYALILVAAGLVVLVGTGWDRPWPRVVALAALCFAAPLAKESGYALAPAVVAWELIGLGGAAPLRTRIVRSTAAVLGAGASVALRLAFFGGVGGYQGTSLSAAVARLPRFPEAVARVLFIPANASFGTPALVLNVLCALTLIAAIMAVVVARDAHRRRLLLGGLALVILGLAPALIYLDPAALTWSHSRFVSIAGTGVAITAAAGLGGRQRWRTLLGGAVVVAWGATALLNVQAYVQAGRGRDIIVATIERATRGPGPDEVWIAGPILMYRGAQLLGGRVQRAVELALPDRDITVDSEFLQRDQGRPVGPPQPAAGVHVHLFRFDPDGPSLTPITTYTPQRPPWYAR